jgi:hypothetical protein
MFMELGVVGLYCDEARSPALRAGLFYTVIPQLGN